MAVTAVKQERIAEIKEKLSRGKGIILVDYRGISVALDTQLRRKMRDAGIEYWVVKNAYTRIAATELGFEALGEHLVGPVAIAISYEDAVAPAKMLAEFAKEHKILTLKAGVVEGQVIGADGVKFLSSLLSWEVLIVKLLGSMNASITGMVNILQGNIRNLVYTLDAIRAQKESA